jgi:hypothetical protein
LFEDKALSEATVASGHESLAEHIARLRQRKHEVPVISDDPEAKVKREKAKPKEKPFIRRPSSRNPDFYEVLVRPGNYLFREGDPADLLYVIISGSIEIRLDSTNFVIATLEDGECFGEQALLYKGRRGASAFAPEQAICLEITAESMLKSIEAQPVLVQKTLRAMMLQLIHRNEMRKHIREKTESPTELNFTEDTPAGVLFQRISKDLTLKTVVIDKPQALTAMINSQKGFIVASGQVLITKNDHSFLCGEGMTIGIAEALANEPVNEKFEIQKTLNGWVIDGPKAFDYFAQMNSGLFGICRGIVARTLDLQDVPNWKRDIF